MASQWTYKKLITQVTSSHESSFNFAITNNLIKCSPCSECGSIPRINKDSSGKSFSDLYYFRCPTPCRKKRSIRDGSWFAGSHLSLSKIFELTFCWAKKFSHKTVLEELEIGSPQTVTDWFKMCRVVCKRDIERRSERLGGEGEIVEIDESKFGKRKDNRGRRVDGRWVIGGIQRGSFPRKTFCVIVEARDRDTLIPIIQQHVKPGTTIITDCWKPYNTLSSHGYRHLTVNHSKNFKDPVTGAHTNNIESHWRWIKAKLPTYGIPKYMYEMYFYEFMWREKYRDAPDIFLEFLKAIKRHV